MRFLDKLGMTNSKFGMTLLALLLSGASLMAQPLRLAHLFSDHAVLQRDSDVAVWGWGKPGAGFPSAEAGR